MKAWLTWTLAGVLMAGSFASGWKVNGWRQALFVALQLASANYLAAQKYQAGQFNTIMKDLKHVKDSAPLGGDCRPDDARGLLLHRAVDAVNATTPP